MAKLTLSDLASLDNKTAAISNINANNALVETALENTLSRDGTSPNEMEADLDMNDNEILNVGYPLSAASAATKDYVDQAVTDLTGGSVSIANFLEDTSLDDDTDYLLAYDTSETAFNKTLIKNLGYTQAGTGAVRRGLQSRLRDTVSVKDFGAAGDGVTDDSTEIQAAVDYIATQGGGKLYFPKGSYLCNTTITVTSNNTTFIGDSPGASAIFSTATDGKIIHVSGASRFTMSDMLVYRNKMSTANTSVCLQIENGVQCFIDNCWIQGGYHNVYILGNNCSDIVFTRCTFLYASGTAMVRAVRTTAGTCGAVHFYRCLFNQEYPLYDTLGVPTSVDYIGAHASSTAYTAGQIVSSGGYYFRCKTSGTSHASTALSTSASGKWYLEDITDGTAVWRLVGSTSYSGLMIDTGTTYMRARECDFTGPFLTSINICNTNAGTVPVGVMIESCTAHGMMLYGVAVTAGYQVHIHDLDCFGGTQNGSAGIAVSAGDGILVEGCKLHTLTYGVIFNSDGNTLTNSIIGNCGTAAVYVSANVSKFTINYNILGSIGSIGGNGAGVIVAAGTSNYYTIIGNMCQGSTTGVTDGGTGTNKVVRDNMISTTLGSGTFVAELGAAATPSYSFGGDPNTGAWSPAADTYAISTGGSERIRITSGGLFGIGKTPVVTFDVEGPIAPKVYTVATLPTASTRQGQRAQVSDANATTFASIVAGGGANNIPVYSDGTNWRIG